MDDKYPEHDPTGGPKKAGFGTVAFDEWLTTVASDLVADRTSRHHYEMATPGSFSEATAFLLSPAGLTPDDEGYPSLAGEGDITRASDFESLAIILYGAAFPHEQRNNPGLHIYVRFESDFADTLPAEERETLDVVNAAGVVVERGEGGRSSGFARRSVLVFHDPTFDVREMACSTVEDLRRLYRRLLSSATAP